MLLTTLRITVASALLASAGMFTTVPVAATGLQLVIELPGDAERRLINYRCDDRDEILSVDYLNAAPNFLAILEVDGKELIFASALTGSGARYVSGQYVWLSDGADAMLIDSTADPETPIATCIEVNEIP